MAKKPAITNLSELIPDDKNANRGTERGIGMLEASLRQYGAGRSVLLDKHGKIIAGNKTVESAVGLGFTKVVVVPTDGQTIVAVQRTDLDMDSDPRARELALADNRVSEVDLEWDPAVLAELGKDIDLSPFWKADELADLLGDLAPEPEAVPDAQMDRAEELQSHWKTSSGQLWEIPSIAGPGRAHRVLCGDSTKKADVARLWAGIAPDGLPLLMVTDPPYGVDYDPEWRAEAGVNKNRGKMGKVSNDDRSDWSPAWRLFPGDVVYCWHAGRYASAVQESLEASGFEVRSQIIWGKDRFALSRGHYHWQHEPCWYAVREGATGHWGGARDQSTLWTIPAREDDGLGHGTQKPLDCMRRPIANHDGNVYDPFLGAGTTICAAEQLARVCYGIEIEPKYVAVILQRLSDMGIEPRLCS